ncbi:hypothetical protein GCM10018771_71880 [Streptomyces cellulosae]|nr:hypothetical protein GCM10018771_71880 [Streptomyces cellulosae]
MLPADETRTRRPRTRRDGTGGHLRPPHLRRCSPHLRLLKTRAKIATDVTPHRMTRTPLYSRHNGDMPSSPHRPAPAPRKLSGADAEDLALYREKFRGRLPESLEELHGPAKGVVELPLHMAWSGLTTYDLDKPRQRMGLYRTILHEGLREDLPRYLNRDLLLELWPVLRTLVGRTVRTVWEDAFPQLSSRTQAAA